MPQPAWIKRGRPRIVLVFKWHETRGTSRSGRMATSWCCDFAQQGPANRATIRNSSWPNCKPENNTTSSSPTRLVACAATSMASGCLDSDQVAGDFANWEPMHLLFGDEWGGDRNWDGSLEGVAVYSRAVPHVEAEHKYLLYESRLRDRKPVDRLVVEARLVEVTPMPEVAELQEYSRGIVVHAYEVQRVLDGKIQPDDAAQKIQVAHWALLDRQPVAGLAERELGKTYTLQLEAFAEHPQLESERTFNSCEDFDVPLYYDVRRPQSRKCARHCIDNRVGQCKSRRGTRGPIHLKVNCAGPKLDGWESDEKYVSKNNRGSHYRFRRKCDVSNVSQPAPRDVYQTVRHREHAYDFNLPDGEYVIRMHFMDEYDPEGTIRKMDFLIEGKRVLREFNIVAAAGGTGRAVVREFPVRVSDGNGLQIEGEAPRGGDVFASAIEIVSR